MSTYVLHHYGTHKIAYANDFANGDFHRKSGAYNGASLSELLAGNLYVRLQK